MSAAGSGDADRSPEEAGDEIIGRAVRISVLALAALAALGIGVWLFLSRSAPEAIVEDTPLEGPQAGAGRTAPAPPPVTFTDVTGSAGIGFSHENGAYGERLLPETMGSGVAFFDYDGDEDQDLLFVNSSQWPWREERAPQGAYLYRNRGDGRFDDVSAGSALTPPLYGMGIALGDYDGDGRVDVFLSALGVNRLHRNLGQGRFEDVTASAGVGGDADAWSTSAAFFDYDGDADLDLFVANYVRWSREIDAEVDYRLAGIGRAYGPPTNYEGVQSYLYRNEGNGQFSDVSAAAGIEVLNPATGLPVGKGLAVLPVDVDADGLLDIAVANDTVQNFLFHNQGDGTFAEIGAQVGLAFDSSGSATGAMGIDAAHFGESGDLAIVIGNFANEMSSFYVAPEGLGLFTDEAIVSGIGPDSRRALSFGLFFFDYDLDGRLDLLQCNGHVEDEINTVQPSQHYEQPPQLFWNCGADCPRAFVRVADDALGDLALPLVGRGAAYADIDGDGDLDVVLSQVGRAPRLLRNDRPSGAHWLRIRLGDSGRNSHAIGASVALHAGGRVQRRVVMPARSYLSQVELPLTFGLGGEASLERLEIRWPDGATQVVTDLAADRLHVIRRE